MAPAPRPLKVAALQTRHAATVEEAMERAAAAIRRAKRAGAKLALLPEYWFMPFGGATRRSAFDDVLDAEPFLRSASKVHGIAVAGNVLRPSNRTFTNTVVVYDDGSIIGSQDKVHLMPMEERWGLQPGREFETFQTYGIRFGSLVCADILHPEAARVLAIKGAEVVLNPVMSPRRPRDAMKSAREALYVARAFDNACYVVKAGGYGGTDERPIAGRSFIAAPWGLVERYEDEEKDACLVVALDLEKIRRFRKEHLALDRRAPAAYRYLTDAT